MTDLWDSLGMALQLVGEFDPDLVAIVGLSLKISLIAVGLAALLGLPAGAALALAQFPGRSMVIMILNALMGLPPVVIGLVVYILLSRAGPFGSLGLLFTPSAMILAQLILIAPIIAALTRHDMATLWGEYHAQLTSLAIGRKQAIPVLLWEGRFMLFTAVLAGFGRASAEVGAVMIVGGNIDHATRVMTTAIALEASKGDLTLALALGFILLALSLTVNVSAWLLRAWGVKNYG